MQLTGSIVWQKEWHVPLIAYKDKDDILKPINRT